MDASILENVIPRRVCALNRVNFQQDFSRSRTDREHWGLAFKTDGRTVYVSSGRETLSDKGNAVLLPKGVITVLYAVKPVCIIWQNRNCRGSLMICRLLRFLF